MSMIGMTPVLTLYSILIAAVIQDFRQMKISNRLILFGLSAAVVFRILENGIQKIIWVLPDIAFPVIVLYLFYLLGVIGAGDIKLFSVVGGFTNFTEVTSCMIYAFAAGAAVSLVKMLYHRELLFRLFLAKNYFKGLAMGELEPYSYKTREGTIHFSLEILVGYICVCVISIWKVS